ncbi:SGNH hydrolase [Lenzites betulinus]|nr:SGNH hydrolase [Lenzites betulinus]
MAANVQDAIMLFGDSLTQGGFEQNGFAAKLAHVYNRKMDVLNRGFSGYNTDWAIPVLEQCLAPSALHAHLPAVRLLVIWFGANDAAPLPKAQYVPLARFRANLAAMVGTVRARESPRFDARTRVLLMTPPPVSTPLRARAQKAKEPPRELDREFGTTQAYAEAVGEVGRELGVPVVDLWGRLYEEAGRDEVGMERFLTDGLHLNEEGYAIVFEELVKTIKEEYPEYHYENLQSVFAYFDVFANNPDNYAEFAQKRSAFPSELS